MAITKKQLDELYKKYDELDEQRQKASEMLRTAQDRFGETEIEIEREGRKISVPQKFLWKEVMENGKKCQAAEALKEKHPGVFESYDKEEQLAKEVNNLIFQNFGIASHQQVSLRDILGLIDTMMDYKLKEHNKKK